MQEAEKSSKDEKFTGPTVLPLYFHVSDSGMRVYGEGKDAGKRYFQARLTSSDTDYTDVIRLMGIVTLEELLDRQEKYWCLSEEKEFITLRHYVDAEEFIKAERAFKMTVKHPDYSTVKRGFESGRVLDNGAIMGLAYALAVGYCGGPEVDSKVRVERLYSEAEELGVKVELQRLRVSLLRFTDKSTIARIINMELLDESELPKFFSSLADWQLALTNKAVESTSSRYSNPHPYAAVLGNSSYIYDTGKVIEPDVRYIPYVFRTHLAYLKSLLGNIDEESRLRTADVVTGVRNLYDFASRVITSYNPSDDAGRNADIAYAVALASELNPQFIQVVKEFQIAYKKIRKATGKDAETDETPPEGRVPSTRKRRDEIREYGGRGDSSEKSRNFRLRDEIKGNSD